MEDINLFDVKIYFPNKFILTPKMSKHTSNGDIIKQEIIIVYIIF